MSSSDFPQRIVCLTEETTETLYRLGAGDRIVGISGYTVRPPEARQKPKVSAFLNAKFDKILELQPDLVLTFSNLQADITRELVLRGVTVFNFNQRSVEEIFAMMLTLGRLIGEADRAAALEARLRGELATIAAAAAQFPRRPRVFFEEWNDPLISGIRWVEELIELAGGTAIFPELREVHNAGARIVTPAAVLERKPDVVIASWCGAKVNKKTIHARPGWAELPVFEIKSTYILQPGPAALTEGVRQLHAILAHVAEGVAAALAPEERLDPALRLA